MTDYSDKVFEELLHSFYKSREWKEIKKGVYFRLKNKCAVCETRENLVVDHIRPVRHFWEERLNPDNLQILCNDCNLEKGSKVDWTLDWHLENKDQLSKERKRIDLLKESQKNLQKLSKENLRYTEEEKDYIQRAWSCYLSKMGQSEYRVTKYDFTIYLRRNLMDLTKAKEFVRRNYLHICKLPEEGEEVKPKIKNSKTIRVIKKNGEVKEYHKTEPIR
jgi:hypothetical protein